MTTSKSTKRALLASALSLLICAAMLAGTTFAWFTDSVTSGKNKIVAGNLDVELEYATAFDDEGNPTAWKSVESKTDLFSVDPVWEPGHTEVVVLKVRNAGTLALKYRLAVEKISESYAYNVEGKSFYLSDYLVFNRTDDAQLKNREAYWNAELEDLVLNDGKGYGSNESFSGLSIADTDDATKLEAGEEKIFSAVIYMPTSVGNEANWREKYSKTAPYIELGLNLYAAQVPHEEDSFGKDYDADAKYDWDGKSATAFEDLVKDDEAKTVSANYAEDLIGALNNASKLSGYTINLNNSVDLKNHSYGGKSITNITLDGNGHTISGLNTSSGLFYNVYGNSVIRNLTLEGDVNGSDCAAFAARMHGSSRIENCVSNVNVTSSKKAGGIVGMTYTNSNVVIKNCVNNGTVNGKDSGVGGIVGYVNKGTTVEGCVNNGNVTGGNYVGGIAGYVTGGESTFTDCLNKADVTGTSTVGGIISICTGGSPTKVMDCRNEGELSGSIAGALVGKNNAVTAEVEYTEKAEVTGYPIIGQASGNTTLRNIIGDVIFSTADGGATKLMLENAEIKHLTTTGGVPAQGSHWKTILQDENSYIDTLTITSNTSCVKVPAGETFRVGSYTGALVGIDDTSKLILNGEEKTWSTANKAWK